MLILHGGMLVIGITKSGGYKVMIMGQGDSHIMNWRGCDYRFVSVTCQPYRGFNSPYDALDLWNELESNKEKLEKEVEIAKHKAGNYFPENRIITSKKELILKPGDKCKVLCVMHGDKDFSCSGNAEIVRYVLGEEYMTVKCNAHNYETKVKSAYVKI